MNTLERCSVCNCAHTCVCSEIVSLLVEAIELRTFARSSRALGNVYWARCGYRYARNRLAALRNGDPEVSRWYVEAP